MTNLLGLMAILWACAFRATTAFHSPAAIIPARVLSSFCTRQRFVSYAATNTAGDTSSNGSVVQLTDESLRNLAKDFLSHKNAAGSGDATLDPVFDMCSPDVDLYGLKGDQVRSGFIAFFEDHPGLQHELLEEPTVVGSATVQYPFIKTWKNEDGELQRWSSKDPAKPRNKVERLQFDEAGKLARVSVVDLDKSSDC